MQYGKVEICGVNTSELKVLSEERKRELMQIIRGGDKKAAKRARDEMIEGNLRLVFVSATAARSLTTFFRLE